MPRPVLTLVTPATEPPVTLAETKTHLRIDGSSDDAALQTYLDTAVEIVEGPEGETGMALMPQTWRQTQWRPMGVCVVLEVPPVQSIVSIKYLDVNEVEQTATLSDFELVQLPHRYAQVEPRIGKSWPSMSSRGDALRIEFVAGFDNAAAVPNRIKSAIRLLAGELDKEREATSAVMLREIPIGISRLLDPYRFGVK